MQLRCYAEGRDGAWEAICLDFDLAVQGRSFEDVHGALMAAIRSYLDYVKSLPADEQDRFLRRRAPFGLRIRFLWYAMLSVFNHWRDRGPDRAEFTVACPT